MRLIDADKLLDDMKRELEKAVNDENLDKNECMVILTSAIALKDFVNRQPTAYDVDKVVEQLEDIKFRNFLTIANTGDEKLDFAYFKVANILDKAVDIVKAGGIYEK